MLQFKTGLTEIINRLEVLAAFLIPLLYWFAVFTVVLSCLAVKFVKYVWPLVQSHITSQMGWDYQHYDYFADLDKV
jgi:hypothetical protein